MNIERAIQEHAIEAYPEECVGFVSDEKYYRLKNISKTPRANYRLSIQDKMNLNMMGKALTALVHSHPKMDNNPSESDILAQRSTQFTFWIIGTDGINTTEIKEVKDETANI